jgi:RNA polymerase sigma-70 factor (ECF subfamily)
MDIESIWKQFGAKLRNFILGHVKEPHVADELAQELLLKAYRHIDSLRDQERVESWLFRIARNVINDYYRQQGRNLEDSYAEMETFVGLFADDSTQNRLREELGECIKPMIEELQQPYRDTVAAVDLHGSSQMALAQELGVSHSTIKSRTQRGRAQLRKLFKQCCDIQRDVQGKVIDFSPRSKNRNCGPGC